MMEPLQISAPSFSNFLRHLCRNILFGLLLVAGALYLGMCGYHHYEKMSWIDSFVNAAMILGGMGPVSTLVTDEGKLFAGSYALFSGLFFILLMGIILVPVVHRVLHQFHAAKKQE